MRWLRPTSMLAATIAVAMSIGAGVGSGATGSTVVAATVTSATTLNATGCPALDPAKTSFGSLLPGSSAMTTADCDVLFGSSNDTATLRTYQVDGRGMAMSGSTTSLNALGSANKELDVSMGSATVGWTVGEGGANNRMYKTSDGGVTWTAVADANDGLNGTGGGVDAVSPTVAWAIRLNTNEVARTTDGTTWTSITMTAFPTAELRGIIAWDANTAWAVGGEAIGGFQRGRIWRTTDGGANWTLVWSNATASSQVNQGTAVSATKVFAGTDDGANGIISASDGVTFAPLNSPNVGFDDVDAYDANHIVAISDGSRIFTTVNGGTTWVDRTNTTPVEVPWYAVDYQPTGRITVGGNLGTVLRSPDDGASWTVVDQDMEGGKIWALDGGSDTQVSLAMHSSTIVSTQDGGTNWNVNATAGNTNWNSVDGVDAGRLWRVGSRGAIETSTDGGQSWTAQASGTTKLLQDVVAVSRTTAVVVGADGTVLRTTNAGTNWTTITAGTGTTSLLSVTAAPDGVTLFAGALDGTIRRSTDAGLTWSTLTTGATAPIFAIGAWSGSNVIIGALGGAARLRTSTDGGASWATQASGAADGITDLVVVPGTTTVFIIDEDDVSKSTDGGVTWTSVNLPGNGALFGIDYANGALWSTGQYGRVERSTDQGATWTTFSGGSNTRQSRGVVGFSSDAVVSVQEGNYAKIVTELTPVPDYDGAAASWTGTGFFGMCLRAAPSTAATWPNDGTCDQANGGEWRALPLHGGLATASVASTLAPGTTTASFRFGMKAPSTQAPGTYRAGITFEVTAPSG